MHFQYAFSLPLVFTTRPDNPHMISPLRQACEQLMERGYETTQHLQELYQMIYRFLYADSVSKREEEDLIIAVVTWEGRYHQMIDNGEVSSSCSFHEPITNAMA